MTVFLLTWASIPALWSASAAQIDPGVEADVLLRGGLVHDGTGEPPFEANVAISGNRIVAVGQFASRVVARTIDCRGLVIAPGFIDLHNHSDHQVIEPETRLVVNYLMQGCTTIVTGNCGGGMVKVGEYYAEIDQQGAGTNVAHLIPQGSLRAAVMGNVPAAPTSDQLEAMRQLVSEAMVDGAWGISTGLIYVPGSYADTDELITLASVVAEHGGIYATHMRGEGMELPSSVDEALRIGRASGAAVHVSHFKCSGRDAWGLVRQAVTQIEQAREAGQRVTADQYPYIASSTSLAATLIPTWARAGTSDERRARLYHADDGPRIRKVVEAGLKERDGGTSLVIARCRHRPDFTGRNIAEIAAAEQMAAADVVIDIVNGGGASIVSFCMNEDDVRFVMGVHWVATASDGRAYVPGTDRPHPRSYGTFPRKITYYAREEKVLTEAAAIRSSTGLPADILGIPDRGYIGKGMFADIVVYAADEFCDRATFDDPHRYAAGVRYVFVNGQAAVHDGVATGILAGRALRRTVNRAK